MKNALHCSNLINRSRPSRGLPACLRNALACRSDASASISSTPLHQRAGLGISGSPQRLHAQVKAAHLVADDHVEGRRRRPFLHETAHVEPFSAGSPVQDLVDRPLVAVKGKDDRLGGGEELDETWPRSRPCGWTTRGKRHIRSTTLTTRTFRLGACLRSNQAAATTSRVGVSPAAARTTSGSPPWSLLGPGPDRCPGGAVRARPRPCRAIVVPAACR